MSQQKMSRGAPAHWSESAIRERQDAHAVARASAAAVVARSPHLTIIRDAGARLLPIMPLMRDDDADSAIRHE